MSAVLDRALEDAYEKIDALEREVEDLRARVVAPSIELAPAEAPNFVPAPFGPADDNTYEYDWRRLTTPFPFYPYRPPQSTRIVPTYVLPLAADNPRTW